MLLRTFKAFFAVIFLAGIGLGAGHLYYYFTGDFRTEYILPAGSYDFPSHSMVLDVKRIEEVRRRLNQPFHYVGHGHQTFVFAGEDGETMLKLFMKDFIRRDWVRDLLPALPPFRDWMLHRGEKHRLRLRRLLNGYNLAYCLDRENCGLLYLHIDEPLPVLRTTVVDALGNAHRVALDQMVFALQKKAVVAKDALRQSLSSGDVEGAKEKMDQVLLLYRKQFDKGLVDRDRNFLENTGFIGDRAVRIDVGKVVLNQSGHSLDEEYEKIIKGRFYRWIQKHYPEYFLYFSSYYAGYFQV